MLHNPEHRRCCRVVRRWGVAVEQVSARHEEADVLDKGPSDGAHSVEQSQMRLALKGLHPGQGLEMPMTRPKGSGLPGSPVPQR